MTRRQQAADRAQRPKMRSPGRWGFPWRVEREFWRRIGQGLRTAKAAEAVGVSEVIGGCWFREGGGMPPTTLAEPTGRYLSFVEREEIAILRAQGRGPRGIGRRIGRDASTISRELRCNAATRPSNPGCRATTAQWKAEIAAKRPKEATLVKNPRLREYVQDRLAGNVRRPDGTIVTGPKTPPRKGLNKPHRQNRRWSTAWSPEEIAHRLKVEFPDDESTRISHEAIFQSLFPKEFREDVVRVYKDSDASMAQVAKDFGISPSCLKRWLSIDERNSSQSSGRVTAATESDALCEANKRIKLLEQENEVLRRAAAYLSQANLQGN